MRLAKATSPWSQLPTPPSPFWQMTVHPTLQEKQSSPAGIALAPSYLISASSSSKDPTPPFLPSQDPEAGDPPPPIPQWTMPLPFLFSWFFSRFSISGNPNNPNQEKGRGKRFHCSLILRLLLATARPSILIQPISRHAHYTCCLPCLVCIPSLNSTILWMCYCGFV